MNIGTGKFILKSDYDTGKTELEKKIPNISNLATKAALTTIENNIPNINNLASKATLNTIENKIPDVGNLVKKVTMTLKLKILKTNILLLQNLIN